MAGVQTKRLFDKSIRKVPKEYIESIFNIFAHIKTIEEIHAVIAMPSVLAIKGHKNFYRMRIGNYRLGFEFDPNSTEQILFLHFFGPRGDFYKNFPPKK